jgi:ethanolamine utilization cobalamin adenosyltransferase
MPYADGLCPAHCCSCCTCHCYRQGLEIDERSAAKLKASADELLEERELALQCIKEAAAAAAQ